MNRDDVWMGHGKGSLNISSTLFFHIFLSFSHLREEKAFHLHNMHVIFNVCQNFSSVLGIQN